MLSGSLRQSATGPVDPDEVWVRYTQPARWPGWSPHLREVDYPDAVVRPGTTGRVTGIGGVVASAIRPVVARPIHTISPSALSVPFKLSITASIPYRVELRSFNAVHCIAPAVSVCLSSNQPVFAPTFECLLRRSTTHSSLRPRPPHAPPPARPSTNCCWTCLHWQAPATSSGSRYALDIIA